MDSKSIQPKQKPFLSSDSSKNCVRPSLSAMPLGVKAQSQKGFNSSHEFSIDDVKERFKESNIRRVFKKNGFNKLTKFGEKWIKSFEFRRWIARVDRCKEEAKYYYLVDKNTRIKLRKKPIRGSCSDPYCNHLECLLTRIFVAEMFLNSFKLKAKRVYHCVLGFPSVFKITPELRLENVTFFINFMGEVEKEYYIRYEKKHHQKAKPLRWIAVEDINKHHRKKRFHEHIAMVGLQDYKLFDEVCMDIAKEMGLPHAYEFGVFSNWNGKKNGVKYYFAKRMAGMFGNVEDGSVFMYADVFAPQEYFDIFYNRHQIKYKNLRRFATGLIEISSFDIPDCWKEYLKTHPPRLKIVPVGDYKPPDKYYCPECGKDYEWSEFNPQLGICELCEFNKNYKKKILFQKHFSRWCDIQAGRKIKVSDLTFLDKQNLCIFGKC